MKKQHARNLVALAVAGLAAGACGGASMPPAAAAATEPTGAKNSCSADMKKGDMPKADMPKGDMPKGDMPKGDMKPEGAGAKPTGM